MDTTKIKLISFDLWETLIFDSKNHNQRNKLRINNLRLLFDKYGQAISDEKILESLSFISKNCSQDHNSGFDKKTDIRIKELLNFLDIKIDNKLIEKEILNALDSSFLKHPPSIFSTAIKILNSLKKRYSLCLTSNTGITSPKIYRKYLDEVGIFDKFDKLYLSNELLVSKPSSSIFKIILDDFKLKPYEIVHIGDNLFTDIFGAKKCGFGTVFINKRNSVNNNLKIYPDYTVKDISKIPDLFL